MSREREAVARIVRETAWAQGSNLRKQEVAEACADAILALLDTERGKRVEGWTLTPPASEGWYWWRGFEGSEASIVFVEGPVRGAFWVDDGAVAVDELGTDRVFWSGPLPAPPSSTGGGQPSGHEPWCDSHELDLCTGCSVKHGWHYNGVTGEETTCRGGEPHDWPPKPCICGPNDRRGSDRRQPGGLTP